MKTTSIALAVITAILLPCLLALGQEPLMLDELQPKLVGKRSVDDWIAFAESGNSDARIQAAAQLGALGRKAKKAVPALTKLLDADAWAVRMSAAMALGKIGPDANAAVPRLAKSLTDADVSVREAAFIAISQLDPEAKLVLPALTKLLGDPRPSVRNLAVRALGEIDTKLVLPAITRLLSDRDRLIRISASQVLGKIGPSAKAAVPALARLLNDKDSDVRDQVRDTLCSIGSTIQNSSPLKSIGHGEPMDPWGPAVVHTVVQLFHAPSPLERKLAKQIWAMLTAADIRAVAAVLQSDDVADRERAETKLGDFGLAAMPTLIELLKDNNPEIQRTSMHILGRIGPPAKEASRTIAEKLHDADWHIRCSAAIALGQIGPGARPAVAALTAALKDVDVYVRVCAIEALGHIGPAGRGATSDLVGTVKRPQGGVRSSISCALRWRNGGAFGSTVSGQHR